jgi:hypothetical protein
VVSIEESEEIATESHGNGVGAEKLWEPSSGDSLEFG